MKMKLKDELLALFERNAGAALSGESLAKSLGVSRNAVCKAVASLKGDGYIIEAKTNRGYVFSSENDLFTPYTIEKNLQKSYKLRFDIRDSLSSTNTELKKIAENGAEEGYVLIANQQTNGKGRMGHSFYSPSEGLYMSILLRPSLVSDDALLVTTAAAVAVSRAIESVSEKKCEIKWVNDVYSEGKKICGILTEASVDFETGGLIYAVLGIGINLSESEDGFPAEIKNIAGSVFGKTKCGAGQKALVAARVCENFFDIYSKLPSKEFMQEYKNRSFLTGKEVDIISCGEKTGEGTVLGIDEDAHLLIKLKSGEEKLLSSGEVSVKPKAAN